MLAGALRSEMPRESFVAMPQVTAGTREIATMRALGFSRPAVFGTFVAESVAIALRRA